MDERFVDLNKIEGIDEEIVEGVKELDLVNNEIFEFIQGLLKKSYPDLVLISLATVIYEILKTLKTDNPEAQEPLLEIVTKIIEGEYIE